MNTAALLQDPALEWAVRPCPLCGASDFETLARHDRHRIGLSTAGCKVCGLLQTSPRPSPAGLERFYIRHYRQLYEKVISPSREYVQRFNKQLRLRATANYLLEALHLPRDGILLDYGCGEGSLFVALRDSGFKGTLHGVEPNTDFARYAAVEGRAVVEPRLKTSNTYDGIVLNHVLEHLAEPVAVLKALHAQLRPNGFLYVDVPDPREYRTPNDLHFAHLWHFTPETLEQMLAAASFVIDHIETHRPQNHPASIRAVARRGEQVIPPLPGITASKLQAWQRLRSIDRWAPWWRVQQQFAHIPPLRAAVRALRRLARHHE